MNRVAICAFSFSIGLCGFSNAQSIATVAGSGVYDYSGDGGPGTSASLYAPTSIAVDTFGNLFIADPANSVVRKLSPNGAITTVAGTGRHGFSGDGGPATSAELFRPSGVAVDASGTLFIADTQNNRIRKVSPGGIISTIAGNGIPAYSGDGERATAASLALPKAVAAGSEGNVFIADTGNGRIRKVSADGTITTIAGGGSATLGERGRATAVALSSVEAVAVDRLGYVYFADQSRIRVIPPDGDIQTLAGYGVGGYSGDGGYAFRALLDAPSGIAVDGSGNLFIADTNNNRVRRISTAGMITTVVGNGVDGFAGGGAAATDASLSHPKGVAITAAGDLYVADTDNARVRKVSARSASGAPSIGSIGVLSARKRTTAAIQAGQWLSIYGTDLAASTVSWNGDFPTSLAGTTVTINRNPAYLSFVSPSQINLQAPDDSSTGPVEVLVTNAYGTATATILLAPFAPSLLVLDGEHVAGIILATDRSGADGSGRNNVMGSAELSWGDSTVQARAGDEIRLFGTGFGPTSPGVPAGAPFSGVAPTTTPVQVFINNVMVTPTFAGISSSGIYEIDLTIPAGLGAGVVQLIASVGGMETRPVLISLQ